MQYQMMIGRREDAFSVGRILGDHVSPVWGDHRGSEEPHGIKDLDLDLAALSKIENSCRQRNNHGFAGAGFKGAGGLAGRESRQALIASLILSTGTTSANPEFSSNDTLVRPVWGLIPISV